MELFHPTKKNFLGPGTQFCGEKTLFLGNWLLYTGVSKNRGKPPKMDGLFHGKPYEQMDDLRGFPTIFGSTPIEAQLLEVVGSCRPRRSFCHVFKRSNEVWEVGPCFSRFPAAAEDVVTTKKIHRHTPW